MESQRTQQRPPAPDPSRAGGQRRGQGALGVGADILQLVAVAGLLCAVMFLLAAFVPAGRDRVHLAGREYHRGDPGYKEAVAAWEAASRRNMRVGALVSAGIAVPALLAWALLVAAMFRRACRRLDAGRHAEEAGDMAGNHAPGDDRGSRDGGSSGGP